MPTPLPWLTLGPVRLTLRSIGLTPVLPRLRLSSSRSRSSTPACPLVFRRVLESHLPKALESKLAGIASTAGRTIRGRVITADCNAVIQSQRQTPLDDFTLGELDQRCVDGNAASFLHARPGRQISHALEGLEVFRPAVGISAIVERVGSDEDVAGAHHLRYTERERQKNGVPSGHVGGWNSLPDRRQRRVLGHRQVIRECRSTDRAKVD